MNGMRADGGSDVRVVPYGKVFVPERTSCPLVVVGEASWEE